MSNLDNKIIFGTILSLFLLLLLPSLPCLEYNAASSTCKTIIFKEIEFDILKKLKNNYNDYPPPEPLGIFSILLGLILGLLSELTLGIAIILLGFIFGILTFILRSAIKIILVIGTIITLIFFGVIIIEQENYLS